MPREGRQLKYIIPNIFCRKERNLAQLGYSIRRCRPADQELLQSFYHNYFQGDFASHEKFVRKQTRQIAQRLAKKHYI